MVKENGRLFVSKAGGERFHALASFLLGLGIATKGRKTPSETSYGGERAGSVPVINMSLAQAIVSAEVLGRPKALQRRRR